MTIDDAKNLLGLNGKSRLDLRTIENAYVEKMRQWSTALNSALAFDDRERAADAIALMNEAKKALSASLNTTIRPSWRHQTPQNPWWHGRGSSLNFRSMTQMASNFQRSIKTWFRTIANTLHQIQNSINTSVRIVSAVFRTVIKTVEFIADVLQRLDARKVAFLIITLIAIFLYATSKESSARINQNGSQYAEDSPYVKKGNRPLPQKAIGHTMLYIRTWPASRVRLNSSKVVFAPARQPVKVQSGRQSFHFIPEDESIKPLTVNADLEAGKCMELRVDLESQKCTLHDLGYRH